VNPLVTMAISFERTPVSPIGSLALACRVAMVSFYPINEHW